MIPSGFIVGIIIPIVVIYFIIVLFNEFTKRKGMIEETEDIETSDKMIDKEEFLKLHDQKIAEHSEAQEPTRMERVSLQVERLSDKYKPMSKVKEIKIGETVVRTEVLHTKINVEHMFTCRDDVVKGMIYSEILSKPKGL